VKNDFMKELEKHKELTGLFTFFQCQLSTI